MAIFKVHNNKSYEALSIYHLRDKSLSWQAMGMLSFMLSCRDDFKFSIEGLTECSHSGNANTRTALNELKDKGYVCITRITNDKGKVTEWLYDIYETPQVDGNPHVEKPHVGNPHVETYGQSISNSINTIPNILNKELLNKEEGITYPSSSQDDARQSSSSCSYSWLVDFWNTNTAGAFKSITSIQGKRLDSVRARIKEYGSEQFRNAIIRATNSDFLKGAGGRGFIMTFDWFIKPNNFPKVLEGNYDNNSNINNYATGNHSSKFASAQDIAAAVAAGINSAITEEQMSGTYREQY